MKGWRQERTALIVVDLQPDFLPGGPLAVEAGDEVVAPICDLVASGAFPTVVATQDWHPPAHVSFASRHPGREPFESVELYGRPQTLWPDHCVQGSAGAALHERLPDPPLCAVVRKGADPEVDSYSAFRDNWHPGGERPATGLTGYLRERGVEEIVLCGLARDVCVLWSAEDGAAAGFRTTFLWDLTRAVDRRSDGTTRERLEAAGVRIRSVEDLGVT